MNSVVEHLNSTVWATLGQSDIDLGGIGVIAIRDIPRGTRVTDQLPTLGANTLTMTPEQLGLLHPAIRGLVVDRCLIREGETMALLSPNAQADLRAFMNHSSNPNTDGFYTLRDIKAGEELTEDYTSFGELSTISKNHYTFL